MISSFFNDDHAHPEMAELDAKRLLGASLREVLVHGLLTCVLQILDVLCVLGWVGSRRCGGAFGGISPLSIIGNKTKAQYE
jgi:hypothetical protein